jgi:phage repressor protein C with HTH and peptisase S24 domain
MASYGDLANQINEWINGDTKDMNAYSLIVEGPSMEPLFPAGIRIIASPNSEPRNGDYVVARLSDTGQVLFKKYFQTGKDGSDVRLECLNPDYSPITLPRTAFRLIHPVVEWHGFRSR